MGSYGISNIDLKVKYSSSKVDKCSVQNTLLRGKCWHNCSVIYQQHRTNLASVSVHLYNTAEVGRAARHTVQLPRTAHVHVREAGEICLHNSVAARLQVINP